MIKSMVVEFRFFRMEVNMKGCSPKENKMGRDSLNGVMVKFMTDSGGQD